MAIFHWIDFTDYTGDDAMLEDFYPEEWHTLEAANLDEAAVQVMDELRSDHPAVIYWNLFTERCNKGDSWANVWIETPHADHYLSLRYQEQSDIWLFAIIDHETFRTHIL